MLNVRERERDFETKIINKQWFICFVIAKKFTAIKQIEIWTKQKIAYSQKICH